MGVVSSKRRTRAPDGWVKASTRRGHPKKAWRRYPAPLTIDLYKKVNNGSNVFISPFSIFTALSMTYEGARNITADQMADVLHLPSDDDSRRGSFARIQNKINGSDDYELASANKIWPAKDYPFLQSFFDLIKGYYYGGIESLEYWNDPEGSRQNINRWVENQTNDRIKELIPQGDIDPSTVMVLTNAIYFFGKWLYQFHQDETGDSEFTLSDGSTVMAPTMGMKVTDGLNYYEDNDLQAVELPYKGGNLSMTILLPKGSISSLESKLSEKGLSSIDEKMERTELDVFLPKFQLNTDYNLNRPLTDLGMVDAFTGSADFSGMNGGCEPLMISKVLHKAFVNVDEEGTEAAASTAVVMKNYSAAPEITTFRADHPFVFHIREKSTNSILFLGKVEDPTGGSGSEVSRGSLDDSEATDDGIKDVSEAMNQFGIDIYLLLAGAGENVFISPYSIFTALSMAYEGAGGTTAAEIASALHLPTDDSARRGSFARIQNLLSDPNASHELSAANKIWPEKDYPFLKAYYDLIASYYNGGVQKLNYLDDPEGSRGTINSWVENQTHHRIKDLMPAGSIDASTLMVLTNAIYFYGEWKYRFNASETDGSEFTLSSGSDVTVPIMHNQVDDGLNYYEDSSLQAVELPYFGENLSMTILLPKGSMGDLEGTLAYEELSRISLEMERKEVSLFLPRFEMNTDYNLNSALQSLGIKEAFNPDADFSNMNGGTEPIYITGVFHKAFVKVNEAGTEAAAATGIGMGTGYPGEMPIFDADHPFLFYITYKPTNSILFLGKVEDPR